jgi:hypothetical protein
MAINKNHPFEDIDGVKCAVVESGATPERAAFLKELLELNGYTVIVAGEAPPKPAPASPSADGTPAPPPPVEPPSKFKIGVTDVSFNTTNAIFGRLLKTREGKVVTMAYWLQKDNVSREEIPYFDQPKVRN